MSTAQPICEQGICKEDAVVCAALTAMNGEVLSHKYLCDVHAQEMFAINLDREQRLSERVETIVRAQQMDDANDD